MDDASIAVSKLKHAGFGLDVSCYNVLISGFCKKNKLERVYEMLEEMEKSGVKPDTVTYNTLLSSLGKSGDFETANNLMKKMRKEGLVPYVVTFGALIHANCLNNNVDYAMKIFEEMCSTASKFPPNNVIYNSLIDALCKKDEVESAVSLMDDMKERGVRPNTTTFNAILKGIRDKRAFNVALALMDRMIENACKPDYVTMEILTEWLSAVGEIEKLEQFVMEYPVSSDSRTSSLAKLLAASTSSPIVRLRHANCLTGKQCVPAPEAAAATAALQIPTIGIVAGPFCSGQVTWRHVMGMKVTATVKIVQQSLPMGRQQTSSGKTFTMRGIVKNAIKDIYNYIKSKPERHFILKIAALEIYNETVIELLNPESGPLQLLDDPEARPCFSDRRKFIQLVDPLLQGNSPCAVYIRQLPLLKCVYSSNRKSDRQSVMLLLHWST
ncbi:hypothetical protein PIB30_043311 [Stylosanthes scabra]|uniref:Kinesin motor domain-containing protein n=1 Tax=Stylosanthes scabra TaxID=79078 RepID=A0ABU6QH08_9FABA|nr:hypothetical protein [Stylosanthes scabra]